MGAMLFFTSLMIAAGYTPSNSPRRIAPSRANKARGTAFPARIRPASRATSRTTVSMSWGRIVMSWIDSPESLIPFRVTPGRPWISGLVLFSWVLRLARKLGRKLACRMSATVFGYSARCLTADMGCPVRSAFTIACQEPMPARVVKSTCWKKLPKSLNRLGTNTAQSITLRISMVRPPTWTFPKLGCFPYMFSNGLAISSRTIQRRVYLAPVSPGTAKGEPSNAGPISGTLQPG